MSDCKISEVSSRVCELGTKCCIVQHDGEMSDVNHQEAYELAAFNRHNSNLARAYLDLRKQLEQAEALAKRYRHLRDTYVASIKVPSVVNGRDDADQFDDAIENSMTIPRSHVVYGGATDAKFEEATAHASPQASPTRPDDGC